MRSLAVSESLQLLTTEDVAAVQTALEETGLVELQHRPLKDLSGGERQRAWLAMAVAQEPDILLLDEPTTFLDVRYQLELMKLVVKLHRTTGDYGYHGPFNRFEVMRLHFT